MPLAGQPIHQRFVLPGPLVMFSHISMCIDYIFTLLSIFWSRGWRVIKALFLMISILYLSPMVFRTSVVTGSNLSFFCIAQQSVFLTIDNYMTEFSSYILSSAVFLLM